MLRNLRFKAVYRSESDNLLEDFYIPALCSSTRYDRAVGYFSAAMISCAAQGLASLLKRKGKMRLVFGGELPSEEGQAIVQGYDQRDLARRIGEQMLPILDNIGDALVYSRLEALAWMVANGFVDIKVALKPRGIYHEKIGIFSDEYGNQVIFQGSANETANALLPDFNFESINVFPNWRTELADHYTPYVEGFERLWSDTARNTVVIDFPEAARLRLIAVAKRGRIPAPEIEIEILRRLQDRNGATAAGRPLTGPRLPSMIGEVPYELRPHQLLALNAWKSHSLSGMLEMATGAGKTVVALHGATKLFESAQRLFLLIAVPYQALADQWMAALAEYNVGAIPCYSSANSWAEELTRSVGLFNAGALNFVACVVVNKTLQSDEFQLRIKQIPGSHFLFIGDECHHHGAQVISCALPEQAQYRLGLSATPQHYVDDSRNQNLQRYYGTVAYSYKLKDALEDRILSPYKYHLHFVELSSAEVDQYMELSHQIARASGGKSAEEAQASDDTRLEQLFFKRARLLGNAAAKLQLLKELLQETSPQPFHLFYCGDGSVEDEARETLDIRQVDLVSKILYAQGWKVAQFTAREPKQERQGLLDRFRVGMLDALVAIHCLDEGIDIPNCRTAYILASSRNPRQFVQRRGRILRQAPGKKHAIIHDFIVKLPENSTSNSKVERGLLVSELKRVSEFAAFSMNRSEGFSKLRPILDRYDLHHHFVNGAHAP